MNNIPNNELYDVCASNDLSLGALQEIMNRLGPRVSSQNQLCLHEACKNENLSLEIVQLLYNILPDALRLRDKYRSLPIHYLCCNKDLDESASVDILRSMLEVHLTLPREMIYRSLPIHDAVQYKSSAFCKVLINAYPESLRVESGGGSLPIHFACRYGKVDTAVAIQYMLELNPEIINVEDGSGWLPIHLAAMGGNTNAIEMLLKFDPGSASKEISDVYRRLPLHVACNNYTNLSSIQVLHDAYPEAILIGDEDGDTPVDLAEENHQVRNQPTIIVFLQTQLVYARQAQDMTAMTTVDDNGWLPLHRALNDDAPLGSIKLLIRGNQAALQVSDQNGVYPVHIACKFSSVKVVKYLVELARNTLNNVDANKDSLLHYACRGGNLGVVKYLLEANVPSVSERNNTNKLAIHLLFECGESILDRDSMEYVETSWQLLLANPEVVRDFMPY